MSSPDFSKIYNRVIRCLDQHRLSAAIDQLKILAQASKAPWQVMNRIEHVAESFGYLRNYAFDGVNDPERDRVVSEIAADTRRLAAELMRLHDIEDSPRQYFSTLRYERLQADSSLTQLIERYRDNEGRLAMARLGGKPSDDMQREQETLADRIFNLAWVTYPLSSEEETAILNAVTDPTLPDYFRDQLLGAVFLGSLEYYDERRMVILARTYLSGIERTEAKALIDLVIALWMHRGTVPGRKLEAVMATITEKPQWKADLKMAFMELVRTRDTERISRTLNEDVIPAMIKMKPDIDKKLRSMNPSVEDISELMGEENPEWAEMFDKSGLSDKLKELTDLQSDGGDVMMSTMAGLKSFRFFNDVAHWFLPYYTGYTDIRAVIGDGPKDIAEVIGTSPMICDSDKYSIILSLERIPAANRRMMLSQFKLNNINLEELKASELNPELNSRKNVLNKYVQDLYRFYKLFRRKSEFPNPFAAPINLSAVKMLEKDIDDTDALTVVAEFYFKRGYHAEALELLTRLIDDGATTAQNYQKAGFCHQRLGQIPQAIEMYRRSELTRPDSLWTMRRLAQCYKLAGDSAKALEYFLRVAEKTPDDLPTALNIGHCYLELGNTAEALRQYFKVEFLDPDSGKALRPIAWCTFLQGDYDRSADYYNRLIARKPTAGDYLNAGHLHTARGNYREALNYYRLARENSDDKSAAALWSSLQSDRHYLEAAKVDTLIIDLIFDAATNNP